MSLSGKPLRDLEEAFLTSVKDGTWPGAVVAAVNWSGSFYYANTFGKDACGSEGTPLIRCHGVLWGQGIYTSMEDYLKVLRSTLADDGKLLNSESIPLMFQSQLTTASREALQQHIFNTEPRSSFIGVHDNSRLYDWGFGGMLALENEASGRRKDTLSWSGKPNLFWFINRESDLCSVLGTQILPPGDEKVANMFKIFE